MRSRSSPASDLPQAENDALAWLRRAAAARDHVRLAYAWRCSEWSPFGRSHGRCYCDPLRCLVLSLRVEAMKRRSRAGGKPVKARRRKAVTLKHRNAPKVTRSRPSSVGGKDKKIALLTRERDEALEQQTATSEVLQVISSFPGNLLPVFAAILEKAVRICDAKFGGVYRWDGEGLRLVAMHNMPPAYAEAGRLSPIRPSPMASFGSHDREQNGGSDR